MVKSLNTRQRTVYEEGGELRTERLWVCRGCGRAWSADRHADGFDPEEAARRCCAEDLPCSTQGCSGRAKSPYHCCGNCRSKAELERWEKLEKRPWDGRTPVYSQTLDRYFFHGEWEDYLEDLKAGGEEGPAVERLEELRLVICEEVEPPCFELIEHVRDALPDENYGGGDSLPGDPAEAAAVEKVVNDWIEKHRPFSWEPGKYRLDLEAPWPEQGAT